MATTRKSSGSGARKSTNSRSTTKRKSTNNRNTYQNKKRTEKENAVKNEVILICVLAVAILLFLCNFGIVGTVGNAISSFMFGIFGILAYVVPIFIFATAAFGISNKGNGIAFIKLGAGVLLFILVGIILDLFTGNIKTLESLSEVERTFGNVVKLIYENCSEQKVGGGILFGGIAFLIHHLFDLAGTIIFVLVLGIISFVILTEKSFLSGVKKGSKLVYESAKDDAIRRKERVRKRDEEYDFENDDDNFEVIEKPKAKRRMDKKIAGVSVDVNIQNNKNSNAENIHEITLNEDDEITYDKVHIASKNQKPIELEKEEVFAPKIHRMHPIEMDMDLPETQIHITKSSEYEPPITPIEKIESIKKKEEIFEVDAIDSRPIARPAKKEKPDSVSNAIEKEINQKADRGIPRKYHFPPLNLLKRGDNSGNGDSEKQLKETALRLQQTLQTFGVKVTVTDISQGPAVTRYELQPEQGVKVSKIVGLTDDIKLNLAATDIRIEAPIPGKAAVGIEVPNKENSAVAFRDLIEAKNFKEFDSNIAFAVGKDISGQTVVTDIAKMPHMLIAGATGSGKSVCINTLIMSILYKAHPEDVKLIMIDPKVVELSVYNGIPHLLIPVVTDPKKASAALHWGVAEMTDRYQKFADLNVRDLKGYNKKIEGMTAAPGEEPLKKMPQIVIIVDELADLMMVAPGEVEESICRLAQLARAAGIHLIIATQRPSVDVITGLIKANMPSRVAFSVSSGVDSRTILDMNGAEKLLGKGDMLFYPQGYSKPARIQGAFISDKEVSDVVDYLKNQSIGNVYADEIEEKIASIGTSISSSNGANNAGMEERDAYFVDAGKFIIEKEKASIGMLQRVFKVGFNRAARIMDQLSEAGVVGEEEGTKPRKVLMSMQEFDTYIEEYL